MKKMPMSGFIRMKELSSLLQLSRSTIWRLGKDGTLPAKVQISNRAVGWRRNEIEEFIKLRKKVGYVANQSVETNSMKGVLKNENG